MLALVQVFAQAKIQSSKEQDSFLEFGPKQGILLP